MIRRAGVIGLLALGALAASCSDRPAEEASGKLRVAVSIPPQASFVERVGGEHVEALVLVPPGQSPHAYEPTPRQMASLATARLFFSIGVPFEKRLLEKLRAMKSLRVVEMHEGVPLRQMAPAEEDHEDGHHHAAGEPDPHCWLNPRYVKTMAANVARALKELDPPHAADYEKNLQAFQAELDAADARIAKALEPLKGREMMVFHPAFGYFCDAYGLKQVVVEAEGKEPSARQLAAFIERAKRAGAKVIFVEPQFSRRSAEAIAAAVGAEVVALDPLARDYVANLEAMAQAIRKALTPEGTR